MYNSVIECVKVSNVFIGLKKTCLGVLDRGERGNDNGTSLKEGGLVEMSTTVLHSRAAPSLEYLPSSRLKQSLYRITNIKIPQGMNL